MAKRAPARSPKIELLVEVGIKLNDRDREFARSLTEGFYRYGGLSPNQWNWVDKLIERADNNTQSKPAVESVSAQPVASREKIEGLVELFRKARDKDIHEPKIKFEVGEELYRLGYHKPTGRIYMNKNDEGRWETLGWIDSIGLINHYGKHRVWPEALLPTIRQLISNPSEFGRIHGRRTKWCIYCGSKLTSEDSLYYGYGPICADNWGLEWGEARSHIEEEKAEEAAKEIEEFFSGTRPFQVEELPASPPIVESGEPETDVKQPSTPIPEFKKVTTQLDAFMADMRARLAKPVSSVEPEGFVKNPLPPVPETKLEKDGNGRMWWQKD